MTPGRNPTPCYVGLTMFVKIHKLHWMIILQLQHKVHEPGHISQGGSSLSMPLCMRDHIVTPNITRISSSRLNIVHVQVPSCQVVGKHVQFWGESGSSFIDRWQQVYSLQQICVSFFKGLELSLYLQDLFPLAKRKHREVLSQNQGCFLIVLHSQLE